MQECDLIMKGGITSGVVYPHAIVEIAKEYRLRNVGGTSAGAIAAVFAAAAEYRRQKSGGEDERGFALIGALAEELAVKMQTLFQPAPPLRPLFEILIASVSEDARARGRPRAILSTLARVYWVRLALAGASMLIWLTASLWLDSIAWFLFGALLAAVLLVVSFIGSAHAMIFRALPAYNFGLCPGTRQTGHDEPGFTDWIADKIDLIAGNVDAQGRPCTPLTVGQLEQHKIGISTMTTDLSSQRPYQLPMRTAIHYFREEEFARLLPARVLAYLKKAGGAVQVDDPAAPKDLYRVPVGPDFPVLLVARMSLSFPGLISAMGLYRHDNEAARLANGAYPVRRCLFSDGGISSNFPIHFFDALAPTRPTFGIALGAWNSERHGTHRIDLPTRGRTSTALPIASIDGLADFASSIINTAKDWQDTMQSMLPGYAERIVTIRLDETKEGGINLAMNSDTIGALTGLGRDAGRTLRERFSYTATQSDAGTRLSAFDQHRYNRSISLLPELEEALAGYAAAMCAAPAGAPAGTLTGFEVLTNFVTAHYENSDRWRREVFASFAKKLIALGRKAEAAHADPRPSSVRSGKIPSIDSAIRLVAQADRVPRAEDRR